LCYQEKCLSAIRIRSDKKCTVCILEATGFTKQGRKEGGAEGCDEDGCGRGMGGRREGQSCVKKVGVVVDLYNHSIAFKKWFYRKKIARLPIFFTV